MPEELINVFKNNLSFSVNANKKTADLTVLPHGEDKAISVHINYQLVENGDSTEIIVTNAASDRLWINELLELWLEKSNFHYTLPQNIAGFVKMFLK